MNLEDFERRGDKDHARFVTQVRDVSGDEVYELTLAAPEADPLTLLDAVSFALPPPFPFVPVFQIFGFTTGVCGKFTAFGA